MGCDIHSIVQIGEKNYDSNKIEWRTVEARLNGDPRDYDYFGILANVRNGRGFAGLKTGEGFESISEPKGFPKGLAVTDGEYVEGHWLGDHSHSWLTLQEMLDFAKDDSRRSTKEAWVTLEIYKTWREKKGYPESYCGGVSGPNIKHVTMEEADALLATGVQDPGERIYVKVIWEVSYTDVSSWKECLDRMQEIAANFYKTREPEMVRMVFGFDS